MKKLAALLALLLLSVLLAQSACAESAGSAESIQETIWYAGSASYLQDSDVFQGKKNSTQHKNLKATLSSVWENFRSDTQSTFLSFLLNNEDYLPASDPACTRKALYAELNVSLADSMGDTIFWSPDYMDGSETVHPVLPLSAFIPQGTRFKNLRVLHVAKKPPLRAYITGNVRPSNPSSISACRALTRRATPSSSTMWSILILRSSAGPIIISAFPSIISPPSSSSGTSCRLSPPIFRRPAIPRLSPRGCFSFPAHARCCSQESAPPPDLQNAKTARLWLDRDARMAYNVGR